MELVATEDVLAKILDKHDVDLLEAEEAFFNHEGRYLIDGREKHRTNPPTVWFISETFAGRLLKIVMIPHMKQQMAILRTAYEPNDLEIQLYEENQR